MHLTDEMRDRAWQAFKADSLFRLLLNSDVSEEGIACAFNEGYNAGLREALAILEETVN